MSDYDIIVEQKGETKLYFNLADALGRPSRTKGTFRSTQFPRQALKMQQGDTMHSDREPPYASLEQRDFSGGRGWDRLDRDKTRFYDSYRAQTWQGGVVMLGPEETYGSGIRPHVVNHWWDDNEDAAEDIAKVTVDVGEATEYISYKFTPSTSFTPAYVYLALGNLEHNLSHLLFIEVWSDDGSDKPNSKIFGTAAQKPDVYEKIHRFAFSSPSGLTSGTKYHLVIYTIEAVSASWTSSPYHFFCSDDVPADTAHKSVDGSTWVALADGIFFRLVRDETDFEIFPFEHLGALYQAVSFYDGSAPEIYMNGARGDVTTATATTLNIAGAPWTADEWIGCIVKLYSGTGADADRPWRMITDNDTNTLTVDVAWDINPDETTKFVVVMSDKYTEVTGHGMLGRITSVTVYGNIVYFAKGDFSDIYHMYDDTFAMESGNRGTYIQVAPDSATGEMTVYLARASFPPQVESATPEFSDDGVTFSDLDFSNQVAVGDSNMEDDDGSWGNYGAPTYHDQVSTKYEGSYGRKVIAMSAGVGGTQTLSGFTVNALYHVEAWMRVDSGTAEMQFDGTELDAVTTTGSWVYMHGYKATTSATPTLRFISKGGLSTFYYDAVKISRVSLPLPVGHQHITGLVIAGEPRRLYVLTDAGVLRENYGFYRDVSPGEFISARDERNGHAHAKTGSDIYLSFLDNVVKYYDEQITIIGPNLNDEGLPSDRRGNIAHMVMYGEWLLVAIDGGPDNISSILLYNKLGWHEYYRAPAAGMRITKMFVQPMPAGYVDRLWFKEDCDIAWLPVDMDPSANDNYRFLPFGWVEMSTVYGSLPDVEKFFHKIRIAADDLAAVNDDPSTDRVIRTSPRSEDGYDQGGDPPAGETYETVWGTFDVSPVDELSIDEFWSMADFTLRRLQVRLSFYSSNHDTTPKLRAVVVDFMEHLPVAWSYTMRLVTRDRRLSLTGEIQEDDAEDDISTLKTYVDSAEPVRIYTPFGVASKFQGKLTAITDIEPVGHLRRGDRERYVFTLTVVDA